MVRLLSTVGRIPAKHASRDASSAGNASEERERRGPLGGVAAGLRHAARERLAQQLRDSRGPEVGVLGVLGQVRHFGEGLRVGLAHLVQVGRGEIAPALVQVVHGHEHALDGRHLRVGQLLARTEGVLLLGDHLAGGHAHIYDLAALQELGDACDGRDGRLNRQVEEAYRPHEVGPAVTRPAGYCRYPNMDIYII